MVSCYANCIPLSFAFFTLIFSISSISALRLKNGLPSTKSDVLQYYSRKNCERLGLLPKWNDAGYIPSTHFEKLFTTPLNIDLIAAAHSGNETGFEQVTADWGCDFKSCYGTGPTGTGCSSIGFYGPGAKDPAGGGCPRGPVRVYEDLSCAIKLGLKSDPDLFKSFCDTSHDERIGMFECLAFFANVITETGAFAETEERDPRPYCWNREEGNSDCCPASDHKPCLPDSDAPLNSGDYPQPHEKWLTSHDYPGKCCSYHGRGFLQVSYEPNYQEMSAALFNDRNLLWRYPYKLDSDGVMGWSAALWFWFHSHPAQVGNAEHEEVERVAPRAEVFRWREGRGLPGAINVINGAECSGAMNVQKALSRVSYFHAIAHRMKAKPPLEDGEDDISYYPLPGTAECDRYSFCRLQFHNTASVCPVFGGHLDCSQTPYIVKASTPMGFMRETIKMTGVDGETPICQIRRATGPTPAVWKELQKPFTPINYWWKMLDIHRENVCEHVKLMYPPDAEAPKELVEGETKYCTEVCWKDFSWDVSDHGKPCDEPQKPCKTLGEYMSHPLPKKGWETGEMGDYQGGAYLGRVGPGLVMALNGEFGFGDQSDSLCYHFGATACHWNIGMGCYVHDKTNVHKCRVFVPDVPPLDTLKTLYPKEDLVLEAGERPAELLEALKYYDEENCPGLKGATILEQLFPNGPQDMDFLFSVQYSQSDGFANARYDDDDPSVNENTILKGFKGPNHVWKNMLCAFQLGVPSDPEYFQKHFGLRSSLNSAFEVPYPLSEDQKRFALLEFIAFAANIVKETGAMGQAEERDPRCYCNHQGGVSNPCCPNDYGNNPPCYTKTNSLNQIISPEEMKRGTTIFAQCCSYHGRGFLQTSYELNYGDLGAFMFKSDTIDEEMGRKLLVNYPQVIDGFGITGWAATFAFWLHEHPCQYCEGRNSTTVDWNANRYSPHAAMVNYDQPGQGLGLTFSIINGQECESAQTTETELSWMGGAMRLSLFYNMAYRLQLKAPGEHTILPLPGTTECDQSPFCRGTFYPNPKQVAEYRQHAGGCWAITPQPQGTDFEVWPWCRVRERIKGTSKYGAVLDTVSFSIKKSESGSCTLLQEFTCGAKILSKNSKPSMFNHEELKVYTEPHTVTNDYDHPLFTHYKGMGPDELCQYAIDRDPSNQYPLPNQNCEWWCRQPSGGASCKAMDPKTCVISESGYHLVLCINAFFQTMGVTKDCEIPLLGSMPSSSTSTKTTQTHIQSTVLPSSTTKHKTSTNVTTAVTAKPSTSASQIATTPLKGGCDTCTECISTSGNSWDDDHCAKCSLGAQKANWPCSNEGFCKCGSGSDKPIEPHRPDTCDNCAICVSFSGNSWDDDHCAKCARGEQKQNWPCNTLNFCTCK